MTKINYKEIIVVEGEHDKAKILEVYPNSEVIITNGSEVSKETIEMLKELNKEKEIILFLDPDYPGKRIRAILEENLPNIKHAFLAKEKAIDNKKHKVGIEHAKKEDIVESLNNLLTVSDEKGSLTMSDLYDLGLIGSLNSKDKRKKLSSLYPIGEANGKTLLKRLNYLNISKKELEDIDNG